MTEIISLHNHIILDIIPKLAINKEEMEIDEITKDLLNWEEE